MTETPDRDQPGPTPLPGAAGEPPARDPYAYVPPDPTRQPPPPPYGQPAPPPPPYGQPAPPPPPYGQPAYGTPPPAQAPYGTPPPAQVSFAPAAPQDGMAVAAFVLSLACMGIVAVPLAIWSLVRIRRTGARGRVLAWLALVISAVSLLILVAIVALALLVPPDRDATGAVTEPQSLSVTDLEIGDCLVRVPSTTTATSDVDVTPCANPHRGEVFANFDLPAGAYPGDELVSERAGEGCDDRLPASAEKAAKDLEVFYLTPQRESWRFDRTVTCMLVSEDAPLTGRVIP